MVVSAIKFVLVVATIVGATLLWRYGRPVFAEKWRMSSCVGMVQADVDQALWVLEPKVESCTGEPGDASCLVSTTELGVRRTAPVTSWDCTRRHVPDGFREAASKVAFNFGSGKPLEDMIEGVAKTSYEGAFNDTIQAANGYLAPRFAERRQRLQAQAREQSQEQSQQARDKRQQKLGD